MATPSTTTPIDGGSNSRLSEPPPLNYTLRTRKLSIAIFWFLILVDAIAVPIALYYGLWYHTGLSHNAVFSISTAALGSVSIFEYFLRFWRLWKKSSRSRVIGAKRLYLDWFHWLFTFTWLILMVELIVGTVPHEPYMRLLAMPLASLVYVFGFYILLCDILRYYDVRIPVRISSMPRGAPLRPGIYPLIEDIVAVDGSGGTEYRERLNARWEASPRFRRMITHLSWFWSVLSILVAAVTTVIIFTIDREIAYCLGWTLPFIWAGIWVVITIKWVQRELKIEHAEWNKELRV